MKVILGNMVTIMVREEDFVEMSIEDDQIVYLRPNERRVTIKIPNASIVSNAKETRKELSVKNVERQTEEEKRKIEQREVINIEKTIVNDTSYKRIDEEFVQLKLEMGRRIEKIELSLKKTNNILNEQVEKKSNKILEQETKKTQEDLSKLKMTMHTLIRNFTESEIALERNMASLEDKFRTLEQKYLKSEKSMQRDLDVLIDDIDSIKTTYINRSRSKYETEDEQEYEEEELYLDYPSISPYIDQKKSGRGSSPSKNQQSENAMTKMKTNLFETSSGPVRSDGSLFGSPRPKEAKNDGGLCGKQQPSKVLFGGGDGSKSIFGNQLPTQVKSEISSSIFGSQNL